MVIHPARENGYCEVVTEQGIHYVLKESEFETIVKALRANWKIIEVIGVMDEDVLIRPEVISSVERVSAEALLRHKAANEEYHKMCVIEGDDD